MRFGVYIPDNLEGPAPVLYHLSGMSCTEQTFIQRSGFQRWAAHYGIIVVSPDVCPSNNLMNIITKVLYSKYNWVFRSYFWC